MKPYGVRIIEGPDVADIKSMGAKGSTGKFAGKSGDYHPYSKGNSKKKTRRYWKKRARNAQKEIIEKVETLF